MPQKLNIRNIEQLRQANPLLAEALESIADQVGHVADQTTATLHGTTAPPAPPGSVTVTAAGGVHEIAIVDDNPQVQRGINYFAEYSASPSFAQASTIDMGASRNHRVMLGNQTFYWRVRAGYPTSPPSAPTYFGTASQPTAVVGGGAITGPAPLPSQGTGTSVGPNGGDGGFGNNPVRELPGGQRVA